MIITTDNNLKILDANNTGAIQNQTAINSVFYKAVRNECGTRSRKGFTLMEIMVVVVIIAVLASVAGPMISDLVDQGKISATKSKMASLKTALITYKNDVGRFPYKGDNIQDAKNFDQDALLALTSDKNVLVNQAVTFDVARFANNTTGTDSDGQSYYTFYGRNGKKWKGPYMDSDPSDFMVDAWGRKIVYYAGGNNLYLWSAGPDGSLELNKSIDEIAKSGEEDDIDDIVISVARFKRAFANTIATPTDLGE